MKLSTAKIIAGPPREARQPRLGLWLHFEKYKTLAAARRAGEVATTMASLPAKNLPWRLCVVIVNVMLHSQIWSNSLDKTTRFSQVFFKF